jgi:pyrroline-5-carboxylate reductase
MKILWVTQMKNFNKKIAFIGAGNMGASLIGGLIATGVNPKNIFASNPDQKQLDVLQQQYGIHTSQDNRIIAEQADVLIFCVKPTVVAEVLRELAEIIVRKKPLIISIAAMIPTTHIEKWLGGTPALIRCMPNTPALIRCGATALFANRYATAADKQLAENIFEAVGVTVWVDAETQLDVVTALSGSGPAYCFYLMEILQNAAEQLGLAKDTAALLTKQTVLGAARLAMESPHDLATLRQQVTSPGGTTERALKVLQHGKLQELITAAVKAAHDRAGETETKN